MATGWDVSRAVRDLRRRRSSQVAQAAFWTSVLDTWWSVSLVSRTSNHGPGRGMEPPKSKHVPAASKPSDTPRRLGGRDGGHALAIVHGRRDADDQSRFAAAEAGRNPRATSARPGWAHEGTDCGGFTAPGAQRADLAQAHLWCGRLGLPLCTRSAGLVGATVGGAQRRSVGTLPGRPVRHARSGAAPGRGAARRWRIPPAFG